MPLNKQKGNMYHWVTHTWNPIKGCKHNCSYCYLKSITGFDMTPRLSEKELETNLRGNLGGHKTIFVGSGADMWGAWIPSEWIEKVLWVCRGWNNKYLFQTKNPKRFLEFEDQYPVPNRTILAATIETNRDTSLFSSAPHPKDRMNAMMFVRSQKVMVSVEPIMDFDPDEFVDMLWQIHPEKVSIGADSKNHHLPEPPAPKIIEFVAELRQFADVLLKDNLSRILRADFDRLKHERNYEQNKALAGSNTVA